MALTAGVISQVSVADVSDSLVSTAATLGTGPYTQQWYRSTVSGFTPGPSTAITGATALSLNDTGLTPGTIYYYKVVYTDSVAATATSNQLTVTTLATIQSQNVLAMSPLLGQLDLKFNFNTLSCVVDPASATILPGEAVVFTTTANGVPLVTKSLLAADHPAGFAIYNNKDQSYPAGSKLEIAMKGNVMYLRAALAISRGNWLTSLPSGTPGGTSGGVIPKAGGGLDIAGVALDTAAIGGLVRVLLEFPTLITG